MEVGLRVGVEGLRMGVEGCLLKKKNPALHATLYLHSRYVVLLCVALMTVLAKQTYFSNLPTGN